MLERALATAEGVSGAKHPRVGLVLLALARVFARTRRISFAEGLYTCAALYEGHGQEACHWRCLF